MEPVELVELLDEVWTSTSAVLPSLADLDWARDSGCPGWSVKDQLAHMVWSARSIVGLQPPEPTEPLDDLAHVTSPVAEYMERDVAARRGVAPGQVVAEFDAARSAAVAHLRSLDVDGFDAPFSGPMGLGSTLRSYLGIAVFDQWYHRDDILASVGARRELTDGATEHALSFIAAAMGRRADRPVRLQVTGAQTRTFALGDGDPVATITIDLGDLVTLAGGRERPVTQPVIVGDEAVAAGALGALPITP